MGPWFDDDDVQADVTRCLSTQENRFSVYVMGEPDKQIDRIVAALALTRDHISNVDLAVVSDDILCKLDINKDRIPGKTPDSEVNQWHCDLVELSISKIAKLAVEIRRIGEVQRYNPTQVLEAISKSVSEGCINSDQIKPSLMPSLRKKLGNTFLN